jgi:hypothetical protein
MNKQSSPENLYDATPAPQAADKAAVKARAKAKPAAAKRTCIMVLGMHCSGTSALTRAISLLGAELPNNMLGANPINQADHWEAERLIVLHDRMLAEAGSRWAGFARHVLEESRIHGGPFARVKDMATAEYPTKARRSANSRLSTAKFAAVFCWTAPAGSSQLGLLTSGF